MVSGKVNTFIFFSFSESLETKARFASHDIIVSGQGQTISLLTCTILGEVVD